MSSGAASAVETVVYYHNDALGSPVAATDAQGEVLWREAYSPYGDRLRKEDGGSNSLWYTAKPHEADFDLTYSGARWYMPATGRFTGMDPVRFREDDVHSFNRYLYANNNPYRYVDPDGRIPIAPIVYFLVKEAISMAVEHYTGVSTPTVKNAGKLAAKAVSKGVTKKGDNFVDGYRAVSKAEADDVARHGFRPDPSGRSMQDKWFSETREGAEKFRQNYSDLDEIVKAKVPNDVYGRSYKHPNIDNTGPGFCVACDDLSRLKVGE